MPLAGPDTEGVAMSQVDKISGIEMHRKPRGGGPNSDRAVREMSEG